jgi:hypothetical protein
MEEQFISIWSNGNLFNSYQGHLKWNPVPHEDFLTREVVNRLLRFNGSYSLSGFQFFRFVTITSILSNKTIISNCVIGSSGGVGIKCS